MLVYRLIQARCSSNRTIITTVTIIYGEDDTELPSDAVEPNKHQKQRPEYPLIASHISFMHVDA